MKYYAVRKGRQPGIYTTWSECKTQIYKYPGAVFKAFKDDRQAAASFLQAEEREAPAINDALPLAYIDGSYNKAARIYSWGGYIDNGGQITILQGTGAGDAGGHRGSKGLSTGNGNHNRREVKPRTRKAKNQNRNQRTEPKSKITGR